MKTVSLLLAALAISALSLGAMSLVTGSAERIDCPGKITCPQTGQLVCRDQCPTVDPDRPDCPGRIECPLTGEPICVDRCPLANAAGDVAEEEDIPSCCKEGG
jgi:hypothetical protein